MIWFDDSDSSSSSSAASTSYTTPASVAAFVKKVKRIRFNSITIAKDLPSTGQALIPRPGPALARATSCPGLLAMVNDIVVVVVVVVVVTTSPSGSACVSFFNRVLCLSLIHI